MCKNTSRQSLRTPPPPPPPEGELGIFDIQTLLVTVTTSLTLLALAATAAPWAEVSGLGMLRDASGMFRVWEFGFGVCRGLVSKRPCSFESPGTQVKYVAMCARGCTLDSSEGNPGWQVLPEATSLLQGRVSPH